MMTIHVTALSQLKMNKELVDKCLTSEQAVATAKYAVESVKCKYGKSKVGMRYRRLKDDERLQLMTLEEKETAYRKELEQAKIAEAKAKAQAQTNSEELAQKLPSVTTVTGEDSDDLHQVSANLQEQIDVLEGRKTIILEPENKKFLVDNPSLTVDRDLSLLLTDVQKSNWMINPNKGQSSSETLQRIEIRQRKIEIGVLPSTDDYVEVDAYYIYSESRQCVVKLHKVRSHPASWDYCYYYKPCPIDEVIKIFNMCKGRSVTALPQDQVDKYAFADVTPGK